MRYVTLATGILLATAFSGSAVQAQDYPDRPLEFIIPFPPGGVSNLLGRAIATELSADLGQEITVLNRAGAGGSVGANEIATAEPDGYTIGIMTSTPLLMKPHTHDVPYDLSSFTLICRAFDNPIILTVAASSDIESLADLQTLAEDGPSAVRYYTEGQGALQDIAMGALQKAGDFEATAVPMTGEQTAVQNLLNGTINVAPITAGTVLGNPDLLRPIAIMSRERVESPDVPTVEEALGEPVYYSLTGAVAAPSGIPEAGRARLVEACAAAQSSEGFNRMLSQFHMPPVDETGEAFAATIAGEYENIGAYIEENGLGAGK